MSNRNDASTNKFFGIFSVTASAISALSGVALYLNGIKVMLILGLGSAVLFAFLAKESFEEYEEHLTKAADEEMQEEEDFEEESN